MFYTVTMKWVGAQTEEVGKKLDKKERELFLSGTALNYSELVGDGETYIAHSPSGAMTYVFSTEEAANDFETFVSDLGEIVESSRNNFETPEDLKKFVG